MIMKLSLIHKKKKQRHTLGRYMICVHHYLPERIIGTVTISIKTIVDLINILKTMSRRQKTKVFLALVFNIGLQRSLV